MVIASAVWLMCESVAPVVRCIGMPVIETEPEELRDFMYKKNEAKRVRCECVCVLLGGFESLPHLTCASVSF